MAVQNDERGPAFGLLEDVQGLFDAVEVIGIAHAQDIPTVSQETGRNVFGEGDVRVPLDGDMIVVVDPAEVLEAKMPCQGGRFGGHTFHHATVATYGIDVVVKNLEPRLVKMVGEPLAGDGHADTGGDTLPQRAGGGFHSGSPM